jgi:hypothetical protein
MLCALVLLVAFGHAADDAHFLYATAQGACQQIPHMLLTEQVFCHGPFPKPTWNLPCAPPDCMPEWSNGTCATAGFPKLAGQSANATGQTSATHCHFKSWDFDYLSLNMSQTQWVAKSIHTLSTDPFAAHRNRTAANLLHRYNQSMSLLAGAHAGGKGFQANGYSINDENYLASRALHPYDPAMAATLSASVMQWLNKPGAAGWQHDRRQNLWGNRTCAPPPPTAGGDRSTAEECAILGSYTPDPPLAGTNVPYSPFVVYSELNNNSTFTVHSCAHATGININHCVPLLLALHLGGDDSTASVLFKQLLSTWDGIGFGPPKKPPSFEPPLHEPSHEPLHERSHELSPQSSKRGGGGGGGSSGGDGGDVGCRTRFDSLYTTRSFGYFLFAQRAMHGRSGFEVPATTVAAMEAALWKLQGCDPDGGGMPASYNTAGEPCCQSGALSSIETGALSLLPYDPRIQTSWFPAGR